MKKSILNVAKTMQSSKETKKPAQRRFGWLYKVLCQQRSVKPLSAVQAYLKKSCLRFCVDRVGLKHWSPILNSIAENCSLLKIHLYSRSRRKRIREKINTQEKLEKLWRCRKDTTWPILYTNFLLRCLLDAVAVYARDSTRLTSITIDGIPLMPRYLDILCYGLRTNEKLIDLSLAGCRIGDIGCDSLLSCLRNNPSLRMLNLSACRLTNRSATSLALFLKRRRADLLQNVWVESPLQSREEYSLKQLQGLHTLILNRNPKFGDNGVRQLMAALTIDYWLKSLSLQRCGITEHGVEIIIKLLQSNSTLSKMDLTKNRIHIDTLQVVSKLLKRKRETTETKSLKKRLQKRRNKRSLENCRRKRFLRFQERPGQSKEIENLKKKYDFERKDPCDLELQLLDVINSNAKLREILSSNNTLLNTEVQERSRTEDELRTVSLELNNLKCKVLFVNSLRTKLSNKNQLLQNGLRYVFEKMESLSTAKQPEIDRSKYEVDFTATEVLPLPLLQRKNNVVTRYLQRRPYCPLIRECKVVDITEC